jgi:hypothetical protein
MYVIIEDKRTIFKKSTTFSNYKKCDVTKKLIQSMYYNKVEESFFWTCELLCSNYIVDLWNIYFTFISKYVHIYNPKLPIFINKKFKDFKDIVLIHNDDFKLRNIQNIRQLFCTITLILCNSDKYTILDDLCYKFDFKIENLYENLKAPNVDYIKYIYKQSDPTEYIIPFNELVYHLKETKSKIDINFWINWIIQYDILCRKKKKHILCQQRDFFMHKNEKISKNIVWIIWDLILKLSSKLSENNKAIVNCLFDLFTVKYIVSYNKKRIHNIYHCIEVLLLQNTINHNIPLLKNKELLQHLDTNINVIFEEIKKHEEQNDNIKEQKTNKEIKMELFESIFNKT